MFQAAFENLFCISITAFTSEALNIQIYLPKFGQDGILPQKNCIISLGKYQIYVKKM